MSIFARWVTFSGIIAHIFVEARTESLGNEPFFDQKVLPILSKHCLECHSHESKIRGSLSIDYRESLIKGGNSGSAINLKSPQDSLLLKAVSHQHPDLRMPKGKAKLPEEDILILRKWIELGLPDSRKPLENAVDPKDHWAFKKVQKPAVPGAEFKAKNPIDSFVRQKLADQGMDQAPIASPRVLARRLSFDLTGLPPSYETVRKFEQDFSERAYEELVDSLINNPGFGERWGRHWLDIARYADTRGYVFTAERRFPYSYTYRDYVIKAFNSDKPFDEFIKEQIAADLFLNEGGNKSSLAGLGFLTLGRSFLNNKYDIIDDRIDVVTRGMMGLTVVCARCHDHKYDPIPTADYYSLFGVFDSTQNPSEYPLLDFNENDPKYLEYLSILEEKTKTYRDFQRTSRLEAIERERKNTVKYLKLIPPTRDLDNSKREDAARKEKLSPPILSNWHNFLSKPKISPDNIWNTYWKIKEIESAKSKDNSVLKYVEGLNKEPKKFPGWVELVKELQAAKVTSSDQALGIYSRLIVKSLESKSDELSAFKDWIRSPDAPASIDMGRADRLLATPIIQKIRGLLRDVEKHKATHAGAPPRGMTIIDKSRPVEPVILERGSPGRRGKRVPRQFLEILSEENRVPFQEGSGRKELAQKIASKDNPLTARVFVNRVWGQLTGVYIVDTPSDFGVRAPERTHPELLDFLAAEFVENNWSIKTLIRNIVLSETYKQQSHRLEDYSELDPNNKFLWKMNRKRLEFEPMRDQSLYLSGKLDRTAGGLPVNIYSEPFEPRRTIYGFIERQNLPGILKTFDFASPDTTSPKRFKTMVPQQALFLMNNEWFQNQAQSFAEESLIRSQDSGVPAPTYLFRKAFQRNPKKEESKWCQDFIESGEVSRPSSSLGWTFGTIKISKSGDQISKFKPFPFIEKGTWKGGAKVPDSKLGWAMLTKWGGHPGNDLEHAVSKRWISQASGTLHVQFEIKHESDQGDGIRFSIHTSGGKIYHTMVNNRSIEKTISIPDIQKGERIDFIFDCQGGPGWDTFQDKITIVPEFADSQSYSPSDIQESSTSLSPLAQLAQAIMMSNEALFVD